MKQFVLSLLVLGLPFMFPDRSPNALARAELAGGPQYVTLERVEPVVALASTEAGDNAQRGWLGVSIDGVPEALAAQLDVPEGSVLVINVAKDSPADQAGIQMHDIVISVDGQNVDDDAPRLVELIGSRKPGDKVDVVLLRQGQKQTVKVELGSRPNMEALAWKFDVGPQTKIEERIRTRGKIMGKGPGGEWFVKDLGELDKLRGLGDHFKVLVPHSGSQSTQVFVDGDRKMIKLLVRDDGSTMNIIQGQDGEITVTRTDKDGNETTSTYEDEDELKAADAEAYEMLAGAGKGTFLHMDIDALGHHGDVTVDVDVDEWETKLEEGLREAHEAVQKAHEEVEKKLKEMGVPWQGQAGSTPGDGRSEPSGPGAFQFRFPEGGGAWLHGMMAKPRQSFKVLADGTIEVRIRKGETEVVRNFASESDLAKRDPKLYEKYQSVMAEDE